ncbi:sensor histidine kinase [Parafilimonas sp.]|uniref:sensor histidine kinase n=1 Tax=Parafilimonas sp. TaxID=1969739 RepID=UPI0039E442C0
MTFAIFVYYLLLAVIATGSYFYRHTYNNLTEKNTQLERKNNRIELESKAFSSQMNPHFIYNSLSAAQYLIMVNENKKAFDYLSDFSLLLRQMFENARKPEVSLADELTFIKRYIELERLRFNESFDYAINLNNIIEPKNIYIPTMMVQPLVENAVRHGLAPKKHNGVLHIDFYMDKLLICKVDDNGLGLKQDFQSNPNYERSALKIINERIKVMNETSEIKAYIGFVDKKANGGEGLLVELGLPFQNI